MTFQKPPLNDSAEDRNPPVSNRDLLILLGLFLGVVVGVVWLLGLLVNNLVWLIPTQVEKTLGHLIVPAYERLAQPTPAQDVLNQLLQRLEQQLPEEQRQERDYRVLYVPDETVNALAVPGDVIIIYQGLVTQAESENELAMVLGHELGHFAHRDHLRSLGREILFRAIAATFLGDLGALQSVAVSGVSAISRSHYSQSQELQADEMGLTLLNAVYGHAGGATDFFRRLRQQRGSGIAFLATHPSPGNRVNKLERLIQERGYSVGKISPLPPSLVD
ncbi:M48 family metalloprotease [Desertifilum sp. FACHB-1129]|uniref:Peptidase M48 n=2 Tax=Desertifilum tharense IPPAS B-1220 TaxID=1781255 RepID=A0A1E5QM68_9CYAN|nr:MULTISPECIES: M48 family metallopeptidase [Desertifilum]MDA0213392.1 M48 family metallopeptidase [Cyanobacteria bacterium FC1]MBD2313670.1 M48 family metalloprotease [Desertifilum sp. FACHB-1129]MBD2324816.1 M48 family metalloprotease [Desertifilum sp. FACHB-866]MBD2334936.1 M48 family metalloprotease [Desertifilum sp. FACHB-868]OEJ75701.1 peptidase M48 [Desertifilum tharense IPPAS B-1220]